MADSKSNKVTKSTTPPKTSKPPPLPNIQEQDLCFSADTLEFDPFGIDMMQPFDAFGPLPDDPMLDLNFQDPLAPSNYQWPWSESQDWTLMDSSFDSIDSQQDLMLDPQLDLVRHRQNTNGTTMSDIQNQHIAPEGVPWEQLRTGQFEKPRYHSTPHTANRAWLQQISDDYTQFHAFSQQGERTSLAQMTLRLTGTAKAVRAFGGLLQRRSSRTRIQKASIKSVAMVALAGLSFSGALRTDSPLLQQSQRGLPSSANGTIVPSTLLSHSPGGLESYVGSPSLAEATANGGPLEGMCISDYLRMEENVSNIEDSTRTTSGMHVTRSSYPSTTDANGVCIPGLSAKAALQPEQSESKTLSLGEGITSRVSPSTELFMLKRRIPKSLHSVVDRNNGILQTIAPLAAETFVEALADNAVSIHLEMMSAEAQADRDHLQMTLNIENAKANATQVNCGALSRLEKDTPVHTRPNNATSFGFIGDAVATASVLQTRVANITAPASNLQSLDRKVDTAADLLPGDISKAGVDEQPEVYYERLSDHFRRRDHFGRPTASTAQSLTRTIEVIVRLGLLLLVLAGLATQRLAEPLPIFLLAMLTPLPSGKGEESTGVPYWRVPSWRVVRPSFRMMRNPWCFFFQSELTGINELGQNHLPARKYTPKAPRLPKAIAATPTAKECSAFGTALQR